jgi:hypothetical protein
MEPSLAVSHDSHLILCCSHTHFYSTTFFRQFAGNHFQESFEQRDQMFKPGWKDIFRMNQSELEAEIRKVSRDSTLDPRRKAYLIQNLMTRFVI